MSNDCTPRPKYPIHLGFTAEGKRVSYIGQKSLILCCTSGWGKMTRSIAWNGFLWPMGYFLNCPKGEGTAIFKADREAQGKRFVVINPFGLLPDELGATACINPMANLDASDPNFESDIKSLSSAIILPDGTEKFFTDSAKILSDGLIAFVACGDPAHRNLTTVHELLSLPRQEWMTWMGAMSRSDIGLARMAAAAFVVPVGQDPPKASWDVQATCRTQYGSFMGDPCIQHVVSRSDFDWSELKDGLSVSVVMPEAEAKTHFRFTRLLYASMFKALLKPPYAPVFVDLDECATSMGDKPMDGVETAISMGRGYGVQLQLVFQSMGQAEAMFGKAKMAAILGSCAVHQYGRPNDPLTAKIISERGGSRDVLSISRSSNESHSSGGNGGGSSSWSMNESAAMKTVPLYREQDLYHLDDAKIITYIDGCGFPVELFGMDYYSPYSIVKDRASPNPYLTPRKKP